MEPTTWGVYEVKLSFRRGLVAALTSALTLAGALAVSQSPAGAAEQTITNYGFNGSAYGTYVGANPAGVKSGTTAYSYLGCTRLTGVERARSVAAANAPQEGGVLYVGAVDSKSWTYRANKRVGMRSSNRVAKVVLGDPEGLNISIDGLRTTSDAYATLDDKKLHGTSTFTSAEISASTGTALDDVLNLPGAGIGDLLEQLAQASGNQIVLPGLGRIALGRTRNAVYSNFAISNAIALRVKLFGRDGVEFIGAEGQTNDDIDMVIGRSRSRIAREVRSGVMTGFANALNGNIATSLLVTFGPFAERPLPCEGTRGQIRRTDLVGANLLNQSVLGAGSATARVYGIQKAGGYIKAWTEGRLASVTLDAGDDDVVINGVVGRATVVLTKSGRIYKGIAGSRVGSVSAGGTSYPVPKPGVPTEIPGVANIEVFVKETTRRSITVTALRVTLLPGTPGETVVNIGNARAAIRRT
jgi:hypothetical protein